MCDRKYDRDKPPEERFWARVAKSDGCWEWTGTKKGAGYGQFCTGGRRKLAHRVAWEMSFGGIPEGLAVCHTCDNPRCVRPDHLFLGTWAENNHDRHRKGRSAGPKGQRNGKACLTEDDVRRIRQLHNQGLGYRGIARLSGMSRSAIAHIVQGRNWAHVL